MSCFLKVTAKQPSRMRAGLAFGPQPVFLSVEDLEKAEIAALVADPVLDVVEVSEEDFRAAVPEVGADAIAAAAIPQFETKSFTFGDLAMTVPLGLAQLPVLVDQAEAVFAALSRQSSEISGKSSELAAAKAGVDRLGGELEAAKATIAQLEEAAKPKDEDGSDAKSETKADAAPKASAKK